MFKYLLFLLTFPLFAQTNAQIAFVTVTPSGACTARAALRLLVPSGILYSCQAGTWKPFSTSSATGTVTSLTATAPIVATPTTITATGAYSCPTCAVVIFEGSKTLNTTIVTSATCNVQTLTATGVASTDAIVASFNANTDAVTGYIPLTTGMLTIKVYPTTNTINFSVCNNTSADITPGAVTINVVTTR